MPAAVPTGGYHPNPNPAVPVAPKNLNPNLGSFNSGNGNGNNNPNIQYNPPDGQDNQGTHNFTSGGNSNPDTTLVNVSPSAGASIPGNKEYQNWYWEQILDVMLGLSLPNRDLLMNGRWTGIEDETDIDPGLFRIFSVSWHEGGKAFTRNVYLSPGFTDESTSAQTASPWVVFQQGPGVLLGTTSGTFSMTDGPLGLLVPGNSELALDPSEFAPAIEALTGAENFFLNAASTFGTLTQDLSGDANQFQGQSAGVFAQLIQNFSQQATYAHNKMGMPTDQFSSYSGALLQAGEAADLFLNGIWNAWANWTNMTAHTPLGAIITALIRAGVVTGAAGSWTVNKNVNLENVPTVGDLRTDPAWQQIENMAKAEWNLNTLVPALDAPSRTLIALLSAEYERTMGVLQPLKAPPPSQVGSDIGTSSPNFNAPNYSAPNFNMPNFNMPNFNFPNLGAATGSPNLDAATANPNVAGDTGNLDLGAATGSPNAGADTSSPNLGGSDGAVAQPASSFLAQTALNSNPNQADTTGDLGSGTSSTTPLQQALDSNTGTQSALQSALTSGQVPAGSSLAGSLNTALNGANQTQAALNQAAGASDLTTSALQTAQADNAGTQAALNQALSSGQVNPNSSLGATLQTALNDANQTQAALNQAVTAGSSGTTQKTAAQTALGDNSQAQHELNQALLSGQVPANSPLHSTIQSALSDAGKTQSAITQALRSGTGTTTSSLDQALKDNQATQNALNQALASGQVPATGPLRTDLNQALADAKQTGVALQQALGQQGIAAEPSVSALTSGVGLAGAGASGTPLLSATLPAAASTGPVSSGAFVPASQTPATSGASAFPEYSPMAGGGMMGQGQGQGQERERSTWLAEDEDVWGTDPDVGPQVVGRDDTGDEEPEEYDGYTERPQRPSRKRAAPRVPGGQR
jgi:hypothetical protein